MLMSRGYAPIHAFTQAEVVCIDYQEFQFDQSRIAGRRGGIERSKKPESPFAS